MNTHTKSLDILAKYNWRSNTLTDLMSECSRDLGIRPRQLRHRVHGRTPAITGIALAPDEQTLYAATRGGTVQEFDCATGKIVREFWGHDSWLTSVCASHNLIASAGADKTIRLWNTTGQCVKVLTGHKEIVTCIDFNAEGTLLVSGSRDKTCRVWGIDTGELVAIFDGHAQWINSVCFTDEGRVVSGGKDGALLWDARTGRMLRCFTDVSLSVTARKSLQNLLDDELDHAAAVLKIHCRGNYVVTGNSDCKARLWILATGECKKVFHAYGLWDVLSVQLSPDLKTLATGHGRDSVALWDIKSGEMITNMTGHWDWPLDLAWTRDGKTLFSAGREGEIRVWDAGSGEYTKIFRGSSIMVHGMAVGGSLLAVGGHEGTVSMYDFKTGRRTHTCRAHAHCVNCLGFSACGKYLASGSLDGETILWSAKTGELYKRLRRHSGDVCDVSFNKTGTRLLTAGRDGHVLLWETATGECLEKHRVSSNLVHSVSFVDDEKEFICGSWEGYVRRIEFATGKVLMTYGQEGDAGVDGVDVSPDRKYLVTAGFDGTVKVFDFRTGRHIRTILAHVNRLGSIVLKGNLVVTGGTDSYMKLWRWKSGQMTLRHTFSDHNDSVRNIHVTSDGRRLFTASRDGTVGVFSCGEEPKLLAMLYNVADGGFLWTTPPDRNAPSGWFFTDRPELIEIYEFDEKDSRPLAENDPRRKSYLSTYNNWRRVRASINMDIPENEIERFEQLVAMHAINDDATRLLEGPKP